nr:hypothetical protein [uncultured Carboxylicivirga sp.]
MNTDPKYYNLNSRTQLEELGENHIGIVKMIKSRIIKKDALKIVESVRQIEKVDPKLKVTLVCTSNICSKSLALLADENIDVLQKPLAFS